MKFKLIQILVLAAAVRAEAAFPDFAPGGHSAAMGEAVGMLRGSLEGSWYNPAALSGLSPYRLGLSTLTHVEGSNGQFVSFGMSREGWPVLGLSLASLGASDVRRDIWGQESGDFSVQSQAFKLGAAIPWKSFSFGLGAEADRVAVDRSELMNTYLNAGLQYYFAKKYLSSFAVRRLPLGLDSGGPSPAELRAGLAVLNPFIAGFFLGAELTYAVERAAPEIHLGTQYKIGSVERQVALRLGWQSGGLDIGGLAGLSAGLGATLGMFSLDYAWLPQGAFGDSHRVGLTLNFGK